MAMEIGFVGLGNMGRPMVENLLRAGHTVRVYNRTPGKTAALEQLGAIVVDSPAATVGRDGLVITMVANDAALEAVTTGANGLLAAPGLKLHISMSTVSPDTADQLQRAHTTAGSAYLAAPVFGRPEAAAAQKLFICAAGSDADLNRAMPFLEALGQRVFRVGETPRMANVIKLGGNFMLMAAMEAMAEAFTLAENNGISRQAAMEIYTQSIFATPVYQNYGRLIASQTYEPAGFKLSLGLKDCRLVMQAAAHVATPMPLAQLVHDRLQAGMAAGRADWDWAALALGATEDAKPDLT